MVQVEQDINSLEEKAEVEVAGQEAASLSYCVKPFIEHLDGLGDSEGVIGIGLLQDDHHKYREQTIVGDENDSGPYESIRVGQDLSCLHFRENRLDYLCIARDVIPWDVLPDSVFLNILGPLLDYQEEGDPSLSQSLSPLYLLESAGECA